MLDPRDFLQKLHKKSAKTKDQNHTKGFIKIRKGEKIRNSCNHDPIQGFDHKHMHQIDPKGLTLKKFHDLQKENGDPRKIQILKKQKSTLNRCFFCLKRDKRGLNRGNCEQKASAFNNISR